jgi:hypothetical protein
MRRHRWDMLACRCEKCGLTELCAEQYKVTRCSRRIANRYKQRRYKENGVYSSFLRDTFLIKPRCTEYARDNSAYPR